ncbi:transposase family protein [Streptomyces sp. NPDC059943]|uniref:helix-turn-helix domain-containing protein n=1 Tax=Streptomyces sp. NPDC059943 TaxID=3347010 RepID=UPI003662FD38
MTPDVISELVAEVGPFWHERHQAALVARPRCRAVGAGAKHKLVFVDRLLATPVYLRYGATYDVLACWFGVDPSTITRAVSEVRPLLAERGCTVARLRTLARKSSITSAPTDAPGSPTGPRSGCAARRMPTVVCCSAARPSRPAVRTLHMPGSWAWSSS